MDNSKSLISKEEELKEKINRYRKELFKKEKDLFKLLEKYVSIQSSIKNFYKNYYLRKLGEYIVKLEDLKNKLLNIPSTGKNDKKQEKEKDDNITDLKELKKIYRQLVKVYHPDKKKNLKDEEKDFYDHRMSEINEAFEKRNLKELKRILNKAKFELDEMGMSSIERIKYFKDDMFIVEKMSEMYEEKINLLKENEMYKLMNLPEKEREIRILELKERFESEIKIYQDILKKIDYKDKQKKYKYF
jgi:hypothetical protein